MAIEDKRQRKIPHNEKLMDLRFKNDKWNKTLPMYERKVQEIETNVAVRREKVERTRKTALEHQEKLKKLTRLRIRQLFEYIFPITTVKPNM